MCVQLSDYPTRKNHHKRVQKQVLRVFVTTISKQFISGSWLLTARGGQQTSCKRDAKPLFHYTTLHYTTLHYTTLHYTTLHYTTLHYTTLHYTTLHYTTLHYTTLHYTTLHYTTRQSKPPSTSHAFEGAARAPRTLRHSSIPGLRPCCTT